MVDLKKRKMHLIQAVAAIEDEKALSALEAALHKIEAGQEILQKLAKPIRKTLDIEVLKQEQGWHGHDREKIMQIIKEMDVQEPIETLVAQLSK